MSTEVVDEKVVELQFDNKQFEKNTKESIHTLDKLKEKLQLKGAAKAAESEFEAYKSGMFSLKDSVLKMWSSLEYDVANRMKSLLKQFTVEPIKKGLDEYETQMGAIQTILANTKSKGTTLDEVNEALNTLNTYADKTIYNFTEMTRNIGTFTAAGVDLETSVNAIQGIANLAAVSGSTSQQASTAMYQLSQALSSGTVKLMDWNSVVNAGMGGQVFQDALKETARVHGIAIDDMIKEQGSFRETLSEGWLTSEILTETLEKFTLGTKGLTDEQIEANRVMLRAKGYTEEQIDAIFELGNTAIGAATEVKTFGQLMDTLTESAQSGWSQTWAIVIGDFEEAKKLWTGVSEVLGGIINASAEARNNLLHGGLDTGWDKLMDAGVMDEEGFMHYFKEIAKEHEVDIDKMIEDEGSLEKALVKGFKEGTITSDMFIQSLDKLTKAYENCSDEELAAKGYTRQQVEEMAKLNSQLQNGEISIEEFTDAMSKLSGRTLVIESLANLFRGFVNIVKPIKEAFSEFFPATTAEQLYGFIEAFHDLTKNFETFTEKHGDQIKRTFRGVFAVLKIGVTIIKTFAKAIGKVIGAFTGPLSGGILNVTASLGDFLVSIHDVFDASTGLEEFADGVATAIINIVHSFKEFFAMAKEKIQTSGLDGFLNTLKTIWEFIKNLVKIVLNLFGSLGKGIADTLTGSGIGSVLDLLNAGLITALLVKFKGFFDGFSKITDKFGEVIDSVTGSLEAFQKRLQAETIKTIAVAIAILAASILVLSFIDKEKLEQSLAAITMLFAVLMGTITVINKTASGIGQTAISTGMLIGLATSLFILSFALVRLGNMADENMIRGLIVMAGAVGIMVGAIHWLSAIDASEGKMSTQGAKQMMKIASMLIVLAIAFKLLATLSWEDIGKSVSVMVGALATMTGMMHWMSVMNGEDTKMASKGATEMLKMAKMLILIAIAFKLVATMEWEDIGKGAAVFIGALGALVLALKALEKITKMLEKDSGGEAKKKKKVIGKLGLFTAMAASLAVLAIALIVVSQMSWDQIAVGLLAIVGVLGIMIGVLAVISKMETKSSGVDPSAKIKSLLTLSSALAVLAISLRLLGSMKWKTIGKGLVAMVGALTILIVALGIIDKFQSNGMGGKALAGMAGSLMLLAIALGMLSTVMITVGNANFATIIKGFATFALVIAAVALGAKLLAPAIGVMNKFAGALAIMGAACLAAGLGVYLLAAGFSLIGSSLGAAIETLCQVLIQSAQSIGQAAAALLIGIIDGLVDVTDELVAGILEIILNTLQSLAQFIPEIADALMDLILGVGEKLLDYIPEIISLATKLIGKIFEGVVDAIKNIKAEDIMPLVLAVGAITLLMKAFAAAKKVAKDAIIGVLAVGAVLLELVVILGIIGLLYLIPGFGDVVSHGSELVKCLNNVLLVLAAVTALFPSLAVIGAMVMGSGGTALAAAAIGVAGVGLIIAEVAVLMAAFGELASNANLTDGIEKCGEIFQAIGEAIGQLIGGFIGGIGVGITESMIKMAENLSIFGEKLQPFIESIKTIDADALKSVVNLGLLIAAITAVGILDGITRFLNFGRDPFDTFAANLLVFGGAIIAFSKMVSGRIDTSAIDTAAEAGTKLAEMASTVPTTGGLWQMAAGSKSIANFGAQLPLFAAGIVGFSKIIGSHTFANTETAAKAGERLAKMAATLPTTGGLWQQIAGSNNAAIFGMQLPVFAKGLVGFSAIVGKCQFANTETAAKAGERLAQMASTIPTTGGLWGMIAGDNALAKFSADILSFADAIVGFAKLAGETSFANVETAAVAGERIAQMSSKIPTNGLGAAWDMASFATQISNFGVGIASFASSITGVDLSNTANAIVAGTALIPLCKAIPEEGLLKGNAKNMESFKEQIGDFGEGLKVFIDNVGTLDFSNALPAVAAGTAIASMARILPDFIGSFGKDKGAENMTSFKKQIVLFGQGIAEFASAIAGDYNWEAAKNAAKAGVELAKITSTMSADNISNMSTFSDELPELGSAIAGFATSINGIKIGDLLSMIAKLGGFFTSLQLTVSTGISGMVETFNQASSELPAAVLNMVDSITSSLATPQTFMAFYATGVQYIVYLVNGMLEASLAAVNAVNTIIPGMTASLQTAANYNQFYATGSYFMDGLAAGISDNGQKAINAAQAIANAVNAAIKSIWIIKSPSKAAYENGEFYTMGLINALKDGSSQAFSAAGGLAEMATKGLSGAIGKIKDLIENGIDAQPTIRPVLDLSDVNNKIGVMNGMLSMSPSVGVLGRVNTINSSMNKNQNGQNSEILTTMDKILNKLDNASGDTININGITYDDGSQLQEAIELIIRAANIERRK